ncbi:GNAT family N-acetyltransferase [Brevibacillus dissolubilis]|uniref:GNAT family N-acetyltransferase n=1 Tax=Brevibacillus dissolubilis TaxID=1844116 RepID=UPI0011169B49|nr:N-acetyltransferase [Brevibacillus dissolubilis]
MGEQATVTLAAKADLNEMIQLSSVTFPNRMNVHELRKYFELFPQLVFKAVTGDKIIGFACAGVDMYQTTGYLLFSNVSPDYQGRGLGKRLIEARLAALRHYPTLERVLVTVNPTNTASINALRSFGFVYSHTEKDYYGPGTDRDIMALQLAPYQSVNLHPAAIFQSEIPQETA